MNKITLFKSLIISIMRILMGGGKIQPLRVSTPSHPLTLSPSHPFIVLLLCAALSACTSKPASSAPEAESAPVDIPASLFWNRDSVMYWAEQAYRHDDPKGAFVVGACYYLRKQGELPEAVALPVSRKEADDFLMLSAGQGYQPAIDLIKCLSAHDQWAHSVSLTK